MLDFLDVVDLIVDPIIDFALCKGNFSTWLKKRIASFLLWAGNFVFLVVLAFGIRTKAVVWIVIGVIGLLVFLAIDFRYSIWWIQEGRFGIDPPWMENRRRSEGGMMADPPEEVQIRAEMEDIWEELSARK